VEVQLKGLFQINIKKDFSHNNVFNRSPIGVPLILLLWQSFERCIVSYNKSMNQTAEIEIMCDKIIKSFCLLEITVSYSYKIPLL